MTENLGTFEGRVPLPPALQASVDRFNGAQKRVKPKIEDGSFADLLRKAQEAAGLSNPSVAKLAKVTPQTIVNWRNGWSAPNSKKQRQVLKAVETGVQQAGDPLVEVFKKEIATKPVHEVKEIPVLVPKTVKKPLVGKPKVVERPPPPQVTISSPVQTPPPVVTKVIEADVSQVLVSTPSPRANWRQDRTKPVRFGG